LWEFSDYIPHPAFTFGSQELPGIWVGKYMTSWIYEGMWWDWYMPERLEAEPDRARVISAYSHTFMGFMERRAWRGITPSDAFEISRGFANATRRWYNNFGIVEESPNNITGESIMMRNRDWGAVAYLTHSRYGRNGAALSTISGSGANDVLTSTTTGNETGIFEMGGDFPEMVAAYINTNEAQISANIANIRNAEARYKDIYVTEGKYPWIPLYYHMNLDVVGNAIAETSVEPSGGTWGGEETSWGAVDSHFLIPGTFEQNRYMLVRGGNVNWRSGGTVFVNGLFRFLPVEAMVTWGEFWQGSFNDQMAPGFRIVIIP